MVDWFADYAKICFENFGNKVQYWVTINEPREIAWSSYGDGYFAPGLKDHPGQDPYIAGHNLIKAHAKAYRLYQRDYNPSKNGQLGMACSAYWFKPESESESDFYAAKLKNSFDCDWFNHALFINGDYPDLMKRKIAEKSRLQNFPHSRLPEFTEEEKTMIKGSADFLCLNYYTSKMVKHKILTDISYASDPDCFVYQPDTWKGCISPWLKFCPWGLTNLLHYFKETYGNVPVLITENGCSDDGSTLEDYDRMEYIKTHLSAVHEAIQNGCNVFGYMFWSLLDNFEWTVGYTERFGLYHVDFSKDNKPFTPKLSSNIYAKIVKNNELDE